MQTPTNSPESLREGNSQVQQQQYVEKIKSVINLVGSLGLIDRGVGYCFSMSDLVMKFLHREGIESELVECSALIVTRNPPGAHAVGYTGFSNTNDMKNFMEAHVVCVTKTPIPFLIDLSLNTVDPNVPYVCIPVTGKEKHTDLAEFDFGSSIWTYQKKPQSEIPMLHQESILRRISKDKEIDASLSKMMKIIIVITVVTSLNFIRGWYDFYQKYVVKDNNFGPNKILVEESK